MDAETDFGFAVIDDGRAARTGSAEVVFGEGKTPEQLVVLLRHLNEREGRALATRVSAEKARRVQEDLPSCKYDEVSRLLWLGDEVPAGQTSVDAAVDVVVVCAGTSDLPVAEEAAQCCAWFGLRVARVHDVGVAGLHRLLRRVEEIRRAKVVICVAGMEGALPSVVAGLVQAPVIGVPTSVGYGAHLSGLTPLLAMVNACAAGIAVVNVDNGFGAAQFATRIVQGVR